MTAEEETAIRAWLARIGETNPAMIAGLFEQCRADPDALAYFLRRAKEVPPPASLIEDLREHFEERAAILEYEGGLSRDEANLEAARQVAARARDLGCSWPTIAEALIGTKGEP